nr:MAG TPA: hypothetical protein [Caudoviricetes sp.]
MLAITRPPTHKTTQGFLSECKGTTFQTKKQEKTKY